MLLWQDYRASLCCAELVARMMFEVHSVLMSPKKLSTDSNGTKNIEQTASILHLHLRNVTGLCFCSRYWRLVAQYMLLGTREAKLMGSCQFSLTVIEHELLTKYAV